MTVQQLIERAAELRNAAHSIATRLPWAEGQQYHRDQRQLDDLVRQAEALERQAAELSAMEGAQ
jgi:hypothetical protein